MLKLMYITNNPKVAKAADENGVNRIVIDLEKIGKLERQQGWHSIISEHTISDIPVVKKVLKNAELAVRVNPIHEGSEKEIEEVLKYKPDIVVLPYFKTYEEAKFFIDKVKGRSQISLLFETKEAVMNIDKILSIGNIDEVHIGLNDLSHSYNHRFLFESVSCGLVEDIIKKVNEYGIENYGFGGIARIGTGIIPAEDVIVEHYRLGSNHVILSRAFCDIEDLESSENINDIFKEEVLKVREFEKKVSEFSGEAFDRHKVVFINKINEIVNEMMLNSVVD